MYSQCPECQTRFRVTAEVLRIAQGTVRCGRCGSAFNALTRLSDSPIATPRNTTGSTTADLAAATAEMRNGRGSHAGTEAQSSQFHFSAEDIERVFVDAGDWQRQFGNEPHGVAGFDAPAATSAGGPASVSDADNDDVDDEPRVEVDENEVVEDITLEGERVVIEGLPDFLLDSSEQELKDAELLEAQAEARTRLLPDRAAAEPQSSAGDAATDAESPVADEAILVDAAHAESIAAGARPNLDLDSTDRFEVLTHVPDSAYPEIENDDAYVSPSTRAARENLDPDATPVHGAVPRTPAVTMASVVATAAGTSAPPQATPPGELRPPAARWRAAQTAGVAEKSRLTDSSNVLETDEFDDDKHGRRAWLWGIGALLFAIALIAQLTHFYRHELVRDRNVGPLLRNVYQQLGLPLSPDWDLAAYELRQWGATETPSTAGNMTVRASIRNRAAFAQPLPLLRLELEDRFGGVVGSRDFEPQEYLRDPAQASRLLAVGAATEAQLELVDTSQEAVGYRLDICIKDAGAPTRCAQGRTR